MLGTVEQVARSVGGELHGQGCGIVEGACIDTRTLVPGQVFFALGGQARDGHAFVGEALAAGASVAVVSRPPDPGEVGPWILVPDTLGALQALGSANRAAMRARVVGLTGSCGKTTTKELIAAALGAAGCILATKGNLNNHMGVPLTLCGIGPKHDFAVVEMGANHHGEIDALTRMADPDVGLVTCVAAAHTEFFGGIDGVALAKGELFLAMRRDATAVVNLDDPRVRNMPRTPGRTIAYGTRASGAADDADVILERAIPREQGGQFLTLSVRGQPIEARIALSGAHMALDACAAIAAALAAGVRPAIAASGLERVVAAPGRGAMRAGNRLSVIDDCYNANPASMAAGLEMLATLRRGRRTVAILGDMFELGPEADRWHREVGRSAALAGTAILVAVGARATAVLEGAIEAGVPPGHLTSFPSTEEAATVEGLGALLREGDLVLVKGSRGMKMERIVDYLLAW